MEDSVDYLGLDDKTRKYIDNFVVSICEQLLNKKITIDEAFNSIKYEFTVAKPVENLYGMVLEVFKNLFEHLTVNASEEIEENFNALIDDIKKSRPSSTKGAFIKTITMSSSMGPGIKIKES